MKILVVLFFVIGLSQCTCNKKESPEKIPVEQDNGIGDGAPSLDSLLQQTEDSIQ